MLIKKTYIQLAAQIGIIAYAVMVMVPDGRIKKAPSKPEEEISIETIKILPKTYLTNITGGEPFIRTDRELYKKSDRSVLSTNGLFTDRILDLAKEFPQIGIRISSEKSDLGGNLE